MFEKIIICVLVFESLSSFNSLSFGLLTHLVNELKWFNPEVSLISGDRCIIIILLLYMSKTALCVGNLGALIYFLSYMTDNILL